MRLDFAQIITLSWIIFLIIWLLAAPWGKAVAERRPFSDRLKYSTPLIFALILIFNAGKIDSVYPLNIIVISYHLHAAGIEAVTFSLAGLALAIWARITLGSNWSGTVQLKKNHELITKGPYALVRHPIYTAFLLMFFGTAIINRNLAGFIAFILVFISCWIKLLQEESLMMREFPEQYQAYKNKVKRLVPFVF